MVRETAAIVDLTSAAVEKLKAILEEEKTVDAALRVVVVPAGQGVQYMLTLESNPKEDDILTEIDGVNVVVDEDSIPFLEGAKIDYVEDLMRSGFVISNPNFPQAGGCGSGAGGCGCGGNCSCGASH